MARFHKISGPRRRGATRRLRRYLIVSEDSKSSLDYLTAFPVDPKIVEIVPEGGAGNTVDVVTRGIELQEDAECQRKPGSAVQNAIKVLSCLQAKPSPCLYARQLPVQVPTKFIEQERGLLEALFEEFAPQCLVQETGSLEERLGLMTKESLIEFRTLDSRAQSLPFGHAMATARELASKAAYFDAFETVIVVENHVPFLILPERPKALAIMGNGYAVRRLADVPWLKDKRLLYWGDIDLSGFAILAQFRKFCPSVESLMMDMKTWQDFSAQQQEHQAAQSISDGEMERLSPEERFMAEMLRTNSGLRLEQEHINFEYIKASLSFLL